VESRLVVGYEPFLVVGLRHRSLRNSFCFSAGQYSMRRAWSLWIEVTVIVVLVTIMVSGGVQCEVLECRMFLMLLRALDFGRASCIPG
jgi:hypothetical protein